MPFTCSLCGFKGRTIGKLTSHRYKIHPEQAHRSLRKMIKNRIKNKTNGDLPSIELKELDVNKAKELSAKDVLEMLKVKRDALNEVISIIERAGRLNWLESEVSK